MVAFQAGESFSTVKLAGLGDVASRDNSKTVHTAKITPAKNLLDCLSPLPMPKLRLRRYEIS